MRIEFYFDFSCPYAYIATTQIEALAGRYGAELIWRPMLLGGVFRGTGAGDSAMETVGPAKARHNLWDMARWAERYGVALTMPKGHPMRTLRALRALCALPEATWPGVIHAFYRAYWQEGRDITSADVVRDVLGQAGLSTDEVTRGVAANDDPAIKDDLRRRSEEAVARGVFGAPTMFVDIPGQSKPLMLWGQDRLAMLQAVLAGWIPGQGAPPAAIISATSAVPALVARARKPAETDSPDGRPTVDFWYDFSSPFAYLGSTRIEALASRVGATLRWRPMLLGALFKDIGTPNVPLFTMPAAKRNYLGQDIARWASFWNVPFRFPGKFPQKTVTALRLALCAGDRAGLLGHALFHAMWVDDRDLEDTATLRDILSANGFDADDMLARTQDPAIKERLIANSAEAVTGGVFGAPTCIVKSARGQLLFWGQDRFDLVEAALAGWWPERE